MPDPSDKAPLRQLAPPLVLGAASMALIAAFASWDAAHGPLEGLAVVLERLLVCGWAPAAYLLGAIGLGSLGAHAWRGSAHALTLQIGAGLAIMLTLTHLLAVLGVMGSAPGRVAATLPVALGLVLLARQTVRAMSGARADASTAPRAGRVVWAWWLVPLPAAALLVVAACNPPGWLWSSEGRGYDALSYHLQLPQEWLAAGRMWPAQHNVYSFLPGYVEAAFYHAAAMMQLAGQVTPPPPGLGASPATGAEPWGLLATGGAGVHAAQLLHAGMAILAALAMSGLARACIDAGRVDTSAGTATGRERENIDPSDVRHARTRARAALASGAVLLGIPWVVVVGSLAYNEMAVLALTAAAMLAAIDRAIAPAVRAALAGAMVGVACGCKPTALFFAGLPVGAALLAAMPARHWARAIAAGAVVGVLTLLPWLVRNELATGNPVFPFASGLLGTGHWSPEQHVRYAAGHHFTGSLADRLRLLVRIDPADPSGPTHRGLMHPQWALFFPLVLAAAGVAIASRRSRRTALVLAIGLAAQLVAWLALTHLQSRFLLPLAVPGAAMVALAIARLPARWVAPAVAIAPLALAAASVRIFAAEPGGELRGNPTALLLAGTALRTGELDAPRHLAARTPAERDVVLADLGPEAFANIALPRDGLLLLVGDATPLYHTRPVLYATTWDTHPLAEAIRAGGDAAAWNARLRERGVRFALVDFAELDRLRRSGWLDPALDEAAITAWLRAHTRPIRAWDELRTVLVELAP